MIATRHLLPAVLCGLVTIAAPSSHAAPAANASAAQPLVIGETFTLDSKVLAETRRINVYLPAGYAKSDAALPVLYMPDGGMAEDFLHVAGLVQVSVGNQTMRPFIQPRLPARVAQSRVRHLAILAGVATLAALWLVAAAYLIATW